MKRWCPRFAIIMEEEGGEGEQEQEERKEQEKEKEEEQGILPIAHRNRIEVVN